MEFDKLEANDPRVTSDTASIRGKTYHYLRADPEKEPLATIFLIHGFPDLGFGWRYQVPHFASLGYQVVAPDMLGFGDTAAPDQPSQYALKSIAEDIKELANAIVKDKKIILGGHDWGGAVVWRTAMWFPDLVQGIFSIGTPFIRPSSVFLSLDDATRSKRLTTLRYQLQFRGTEVEDEIRDEEKVRQFLNAMFGGAGAEGEVGFSITEGVLFDNLPKIDQSRLISGHELDHYTSKYFREGEPRLKGPLNWYRTRAQNYLDELRLLLKPIKFSMPAFFLAATRDEALPLSMSDGMDQYFEDLTRGEVEASHWALWESPAEVNEQVSAWLEKVLRRDAQQT
ncbi:Alpha/Beta hydrolase protein [Ilyonectria sp. MPI-CAGE-AT-0026]|nr:Alpha/Beta hydrolase protein [Ilyonectria sp. MPI-CAGE-AT-0026]